MSPKSRVEPRYKGTTLPKNEKPSETGICRPFNWLKTSSSRKSVLFSLSICICDICPPIFFTFLAISSLDSTKEYPTSNSITSQLLSSEPSIFRIYFAFAISPPISLCSSHLSQKVPFDFIPHTAHTLLMTSPLGLKRSTERLLTNFCLFDLFVSTDNRSFNALKSSKSLDDASIQSKARAKAPSNLFNNCVFTSFLIFSRSAITFSLHGAKIVK